MGNSAVLGRHCFCSGSRSDSRNPFDHHSDDEINAASAILATLSDSGPANMRELCDALAHTEPSAAHEHVCLELHGLIRQDRMKV